MGLICKHCECSQRPILLVVYTSSDGTYQFLCGEDDHLSEDDADPIHVSHVVHDDPTVRKLLEISQDFMAERETHDSEWVITFVDIDEE